MPNYYWQLSFKLLIFFRFNKKDLFYLTNNNIAIHFIYTKTLK